MTGAIREYVTKIRGGDVGALPAVLGLLVLVIVFSVLRPTTFTNSFNFANLIHQSAAVIVIAMGLIFVLLLGEIDLAAGYTAGTSAAVMGLVVTQRGWPWWLGILACLATGAVIGLIIGLLVARLGIPSFVVTLAAFLGLQGVLLWLIGEGGTIPIRDEILIAINNDDLPLWLGWALAIVTVGAYAFVVLRRAAVRRASGLQTASATVLIGKIVFLAVLVFAATAYLSIERSRNPAQISLKGVPVVVVILLVLLVGLTFLLGRTAFGRHVYAVGGNAEAARRAGINVRQIKLVCFVIYRNPRRHRRNHARQPEQLDLADHRRRRHPPLRRRGGRDRRHEPVRRQGSRDRRCARWPGDRRDHQRHGPAQPALERRLHGDRPRPADRGERRRAVQTAGRLHRAALAPRDHGDRRP